MKSQCLPIRLLSKIALALFVITCLGCKSPRSPAGPLKTPSFQSLGSIGVTMDSGLVFWNDKEQVLQGIHLWNESQSLTGNKEYFLERYVLDSDGPKLVRKTQNYIAPADLDIAFYNMPSNPSDTFVVFDWRGFQFPDTSSLPSVALDCFGDSIIIQDVKEIGENQGGREFLALGHPEGNIDSSYIYYLVPESGDCKKEIALRTSYRFSPFLVYYSSPKRDLDYLFLGNIGPFRQTPVSIEMFEIKSE